MGLDPWSNWIPSIDPDGDDQNVYLVVDDFGRNGQAYQETDAENTDLETVVSICLMANIKPGPGRLLNTAECWSHDVSGDVADELRRRCDLQLCDLPSSLEDFVERHVGHVDGSCAAPS